LLGHAISGVDHVGAIARQKDVGRLRARLERDRAALGAERDPARCGGLRVGGLAGGQRERRNQGRQGFQDLTPSQRLLIPNRRNKRYRGSRIVESAVRGVTL